MKTELKNCPFCGGKATSSEETTDKKNEFEFAWIGCQKCQCFINYINNTIGNSKAIEAWNRRVTE